MTTEYRYVADIAVPGVRWYECESCRQGLVDFRSCFFDCERCGAKGVTTHICPKIHNHPVMVPRNDFDSTLTWMRTSEAAWNFRLEA